MCQNCHDRIEERTIARKKTGDFKENKPPEETDDYI